MDRGTDPMDMMDMPSTSGTSAVGSTARSADPLAGPSTRPVDTSFGPSTRPLDPFSGASTRPVDTFTGASTRPLDPFSGFSTRPADTFTGPSTRPVDSSFRPSTRPVETIIVTGPSTQSTGSYASPNHSTEASAGPSTHENYTDPVSHLANVMRSLHRATGLDSDSDNNGGPTELPDVESTSSGSGSEATTPVSSATNGGYISSVSIAFSYCSVSYI